ncbi:Xpo1-domain-containing protein, partial [Atractiella rhizophila]
MALQTRLPQVINAALSPFTSAEQKQEAYAFLEQVKLASAAESTWKECLALFTQGGEGVGPECRLYALQVVDEALGNRTFTIILNYGSTIFWCMRPDRFVVWTKYSETDFDLSSKSAEFGRDDIKNKLAQTLFYLFMRTYTTTFPDFFTVFIAQIRSSSNSAPSTPHARGGQSLNPRLIDLLLRILHEIAMELSDAILRGNKSQERLAIDAALRDNVRAKDAPLIAKTLWEIVTEYLTRISIARNAKAEEMLEMVVRVVADYVPWIDINLMVTPTTVPLIHNCIYPSFATSTHPYYPIRTAAADALIETVSKGMPSGDKVELINALQLPELLNSLVTIGRENGASEGEESLEVFREKLAKLLSSIGNQLFLIFDDS